MKTKAIVALAVLGMLAASSEALEDTPENRAEEADRYLEAMPPSEMLGKMTDQMTAGAPPEQRQEIENFMTRHLDIAALEEAMREALIEHFTADELAALADFYGSPVGKSAMSKLGAYMADVMPVIQAEIGKARARAQEELESTENEK